VLSLLHSPAADGMYARAIIQSAPLDMRDGRDAMTAAMRAAAAKALGDVDPSEATVEQLHRAQTVALGVAQGFGLVSGLAYAPLLGADPLPPADAVPARLRELARTVDLLVGFTKADAAPFIEINPRASRLQLLGPLATAGRRVASAAMTRQVFGGPAERLARTWRAHGGRASSYRLDWAPSGAPLGACHCMDLPLLLGAPGAWSDAPMLGSAADPLDHELGRRMRALWSRFAYDGATAVGADSLRLGAGGVTRLR
jgi:para-nitrobenzyl esterase